MLPEQFIEQLTLSLGPERAGEVFSYIQDSQPSVAVRANPFKVSGAESLSFLPIDAGRSTYSQWGRFLTSRPEFALDPLFHAGAYYVQEASSMYLERILPLMAEMRQVRPDGAFKVLDLCAAPGGKTTHLLSMLREIPGSFLVSNEVIRTRAAVLCENVSKWGAANVVVTNNDPADFAALPGYFDVMVVDAPCSGEGMFRKDPEAVAQWSEDNVRLCTARQRRILSDVLPALRPGGLLVYSTCTFNHYEDEDNVAWLVSEYGFDVLEQRHFYPGDDMAGEGFFFSLLRKDGGGDMPVFGNASKARGGSAAYRSFGSLDWVRDGFTVYRKGAMLKAFPDYVAEAMQAFELSSGLRVMMSGSAVAEVKDGRAGCFGFCDIAAVFPDSERGLPARQSARNRSPVGNRSDLSAPRPRRPARCSRRLCGAHLFSRHFNACRPFRPGQEPWSTLQQPPSSLHSPPQTLIANTMLTVRNIGNRQYLSPDSE